MYHIIPNNWESPEWPLSDEKNQGERDMTIKKRRGGEGNALAKRKEG